MIHSSLYHIYPKGQYFFLNILVFMMKIIFINTTLIEQKIKDD